MADGEAVAGFELGARGRVAGVVHVLDSAAGGATEMGMVAGGRLVHRRTFTGDVEFEHVPELVKPGETTVNRRKPDVRLPLAGQREDLLGRGVTTRSELVHDVEDQAVIGWELGG